MEQNEPYYIKKEIKTLQKAQNQGVNHKLINRRATQKINFLNKMNSYSINKTIQLPMPQFGQGSLTELKEFIEVV
jgi:hypothetical protein